MRKTSWIFCLFVLAICGCKNTVKITSPPSGVVIRPIVDVKGYCEKPIEKVTYDLANASGIVTNQQGYANGWGAYDEKLRCFVTNFFQCYDVRFAKGRNTMIIHITEETGKRHTVKIVYTLDYSHATNPPVLKLIWPPNDAKMSGSSFVIKAQVDDMTVAIKAIVTNLYGEILTIKGRTDRDGTAWVENLPVNSGTNHITVVATDAAGNHTSTNLNVLKSSVTAYMKPVPADQLNRPFVTVNGTVSDATCRVYVNEVQATVYTNGTWTATNVPVRSPGSSRTATFEMRIYPPKTK